MRIPNTTIVLLGILFCVNGDIENVNSVEVNSREHSLELTQSLNLARQEFIQEACRHFPSKYGLDELPTEVLEHILVDEKHKLLYCYVPKVACTNWKRIFMILTGLWNGTDPLSIPASAAHAPATLRTLHDTAPAARRRLLENYHKMIITRNPFERLLSAFRNKLEGDSESARYFQERVGRRIVRAVRDRPSNESLARGHDVTFAEFAAFLTDAPAAGDPALAAAARNEHWQPVAELCQPCLINYTLVGSYDTLVEDAELALWWSGAGARAAFPRRRPARTPPALAHYYRALPLTRATKLYRYYLHDFKLFNYHVRDILGFDLG